MACSSQHRNLAVHPAVPAAWQTGASAATAKGCRAQSQQTVVWCILAQPLSETCCTLGPHTMKACHSAVAAPVKTVHSPYTAYKQMSKHIRKLYMQTVNCQGNPGGQHCHLRQVAAAAAAQCQLVARA
ncbi:hypothetical protein COO60DRAFT_1460848 [Scenedesmus sp. NREL 46B-D3]|nr:hypothetical protein COO60DRAFT_1460848 [Scenedesmus sp. NREL 46B-D3]